MVPNNRLVPIVLQNIFLCVQQKKDFIIDELSIQYITVQYIGYDITPKFSILTK